MSRYGLSTLDAALLNRCVHEESYNRRVLEKLTAGLESRVVVIDFYNVTTTLAEYLEGGQLYKCTDHVIRDNAVALGRSKKKPEVLLEAFTLVKRALESLSVERAVIVADRQRSHSKKVLEEAARVLGESIPTSPILADKADVTVIEQCRALEAAAATSDRVILERTERAVDIVGVYLKGKSEKRVLDLRALIALEST